MLRRRETAVIAVVAVALLAVLAFATSASAEGFADIFLGASMTTKGDVDVDLNGASANDANQDYKTSVLLGGRAGYWWGLFGINLDVSWFQPDFDPDEFTVSGPFNATVKTDLGGSAPALHLRGPNPLHQHTRGGGQRAGRDEE